MTPTSCVACGHPIRPRHRPELPGRVHKARGLCARCWDHHSYAGTLDRFSPVRRSQAETVEEFVWLIDGGATLDDAARRLGYPHGVHTVLAQALRRAGIRVPERAG